MYQFFNADLFGVSMNTANWIANGIVALVAVFILFLLYRMFTRPRMASGRRSKNARLAITDAASIDDRRRLVLVRRDNIEHLIMIGGETDMVIESDIGGNRAAHAASTEAVASPPVATGKPAPSPTQPSRPSPPPPPPIPRAEPGVAAKPASPAPAVAKPATPATPVAPATPSAPAKPAPIKPATPSPATSPSVTVKPTHQPLQPVTPLR